MDRATSYADVKNVNNLKNFAKMKNLENILSNNKMNNNNDNDHYEDHYEPTVRQLQVRKSVTGSCGFHLTRSKWDPYPWVSAVDAHTPAEMSGLQVGDCVLEVNGEDVLGLRITDIAKLVKAKSGHVTLLLWNSGHDETCNPENLCCGPMPRSLQRLSLIVQSILSIIECPVCLDSIPPPAMQCQNGHLLCLNCRIRAEKCPVCRDRYTPQRALIAERIYTTIVDAFQLCSNEDKLRQKVFGLKVKQPQPSTELTPIDCTQQQHKQPQQRQRSKSYQLSPTRQHVALGMSQAGHYRLCNGTKTSSVGQMNTLAGAEQQQSGEKSTFLMKLWRVKACSMDNLSKVMLSGTAHKEAACASLPLTTNHLAQVNSEDEDKAQNAKNHLSCNIRSTRTAIKRDNSSPAAMTRTPRRAKPTAREVERLQMVTNNHGTPVNGMRNRYSLSTNDLSQALTQQQKQLKNVKNQLDGATATNASLITVEQCRVASLRRRHPAGIRSTSTRSSPIAHSQSMSSSSSSSSSSRQCVQPKFRSLNTSIECFQSPDVDVVDHASMVTHNGAHDAPSLISSASSSGVFTELEPIAEPRASLSTPSSLSSSISSSSRSPHRAEVTIKNELQVDKAASASLKISTDLNAGHNGVTVSYAEEGFICFPEEMDSLVDISRMRYFCPCDCDRSFEDEKTLE